MYAQVAGADLTDPSLRPECPAIARMEVLDAGWVWPSTELARSDTIRSYEEYTDRPPAVAGRARYTELMEYTEKPVRSGSGVVWSEELNAAFWRFTASTPYGWYTFDIEALCEAHSETRALRQVRASGRSPRSRVLTVEDPSRARWTPRPTAGTRSTSGSATPRAKKPRPRDWAQLLQQLRTTALSRTRPSWQRPLEAGCAFSEHRGVAAVRSLVRGDPARRTRHRARPVHLGHKLLRIPARQASSASRIPAERGTLRGTCGLPASKKEGRRAPALAWRGALVSSYGSGSAPTPAAAPGGRPPPASAPESAGRAERAALCRASRSQRSSTLGTVRRGSGSTTHSPSRSCAAPRPSWGSSWEAPSEHERQREPSSRTRSCCRRVHRRRAPAPAASLRFRGCGSGVAR